MPTTFTLEDGDPLAAGVEPVAEVVFVIEDGPPGPQGPPGSGGAGASYLHTQGSAAVTWTVNHNLGARPAVEVRTTGGLVALAAVTHTGANQCVISFAAAFAGTAFCSL